MKRALFVVALAVLGRGCGAPAPPPAAPAPAAPPAPAFIESRPPGPPGEPPDGSMAGGEVGAPASEPLATGPMTKGSIREVMRANQPKVRACYERALLGSPRLAGTVVVRLVIRADGTVASAEVKSSTLGDAAVERCIAAAVTTFVFPRPLGGGIVVVVYPYKLQTSDEPPVRP